MNKRVHSMKVLHTMNDNDHTMNDVASKYDVVKDDSMNGPCF